MDTYTSPDDLATAVVRMVRYCAAHSEFSEQEIAQDVINTLEYEFEPDEDDD